MSLTWWFERKQNCITLIHGNKLSLATTMPVLGTWLVSTGVGVNAAWLMVTVGPSRSLAAVWS